MKTTDISEQKGSERTTGIHPRGRHPVTRISQQAQENRAYVRRLLRRRDPAYAAMLDVIIWELSSCAADNGQRMKPVG